MRPATTSFCFLLLVLLTACGGGGDEGPDPKQVVEEFRPKAEARLEVLRKIGESVNAQKGKDPTEIALGERQKLSPLPEAYNKYTGASADTYNLRILDDAAFAELANQGFDRPFGQMDDRSWLDDANDHLNTKSPFDASGIRADFEEFLAIRYIAVLQPTEHVAPKIGTAILNSVDFTPGFCRAVVWLFDLEDGSLLGGVKVYAANSNDIDFSYTSSDDSSKNAENRNSSARFAVEYDLRKQVRAAIMEALKPYIG